MPTGAVFILIVVAAFPTLILVAVAVKLWEIHKASKWPSAEGKVVTSRVSSTKQRPGESGHNFNHTNVENEPLVEYEFTVDGKKHRGNRVTIGEKTAAFELEGILAKYPVGKAVTVYYDPANPKTSVLERTLPMGMMMAGLGVLMLFFIGGPLIAAAVYFNAVDWFKGHLARPERAPFVAASGGFGLLVLLFALAFTKMTRKAAKWPVAKGKIVSSGVESFLDFDDGVTRTMYRSCVVYGYTVNGLEFRGDQTVLGVSVTSSSEGAARRAAAKHRAGSVIYVHYNPDAPGESVLNANSKWHIIPWIIAAGMFALSWAVATGRM